MANQNSVCINKAQKSCLYITQRWAGTLHVILADAWESEQDSKVEIHTMTLQFALQKWIQILN